MFITGLVLGFVGGFASGGALIWFKKSTVQADVVVANKVSAEVSSTVAAVKQKV